MSSVKTCKYIQKKKSAEIKRKTGQLVRKCFSYFSAFFLYLISTNSSGKVFKKRKKKNPFHSWKKIISSLAPRGLPTYKLKIAAIAYLFYIIIRIIWK